MSYSLACIYNAEQYCWTGSDIKTLTYLNSFSIIYQNQFTCKSNQGNQGYSGNQKNAIQGQRPHMENRHTQQRTQSN